MIRIELLEELIDEIETMDSVDEVVEYLNERLQYEQDQQGIAEALEEQENSRDETDENY